MARPRDRRPSAPPRGSGAVRTDPFDGLRRLQDDMQRRDAPGRRRSRTPAHTRPRGQVIGSTAPGRPGSRRQVVASATTRAAAGGSGVGPGAPPAGPGAPAPAVEPAGRRRKPRRSLGQRLLRAAVVVVAVVLVVTAGGYGYVRWRLGQIKSVTCGTCVAAAAGAPYNVLIVGSDSRAGDSGAQAQAFGSASEVAGQRSDTIKILHIDPAAHTARVLSIPRDTYVTLSGLPAGTGLASQNKINAAFNDGPDPLIQTIEDTFGIPIAHYVTIDFDGVIDLVNAVGGINLDFNYPVRDDDDGNNNSGLDITRTGCQTLNGTTALALSRSRYYQYYADGYWQSDPTSDLGRIQRQNTIMKAVIDKAEGSLNPITLNNVLVAVVHDITKDSALSATGLISLAQTYHAFSGSDLQTWTLPTAGGYNPAAGDVEVVEQPEALQTITTFLGQAPQAVTTPPLDQYGNPVPVPPTTTAPASTAGAAAGSSSSPPATTTVTQPSQPPYDPTTC